MEGYFIELTICPACGKLGLGGGPAAAKGRTFAKRIVIGRKEAVADFPTLEFQTRLLSTGNMYKFLTVWQGGFE